MESNSKTFAEVLRSASATNCSEKDFRKPVEAYLLEFAKSLKIDLVARTEVTLGTSGRADTIYNRFVVEWERPGFIKPSNNAVNNTHTIAQVKSYGDGLHWQTREKAGRIVGCCTDGRYFIFVTKPEKEWITSDPVTVSEESCKRFIDYFQALQSGIALLPDYLSEDFSSASVRTQRAVKELYDTLDGHLEAPSLQAVFDQWREFFGTVTEYEEWRVKLANDAELRKMLKAFDIPSEHVDLNKFFFATHTYFAILTKLLAYTIVGRYTDLPAPPLSDWKGLSDEALAGHFAELEQGGPFHLAGIRNFLEGDFFKWYTDFFTPSLASRLRAIVDRLSDYDPATLDLAPAPTQDLLKKLYHRLVSPHIRKALGEFYTPDWLAQRVLNMLDGGSYRGLPEVRILDPACGSGTFLMLAIAATKKNSVAQSTEPARLLRTICHNIVGIDLNPLAVIAARTNYMLALGPLLAHRGQEPLDIPVYLADSVMTPSSEDDGLFEHPVKVQLSVGKLELPRGLATQDGITTLADLLDRHLERVPPTKPEDFLEDTKPALTEFGIDWTTESTIVANLYTRLFELHCAGRNGLWARILKNAFAPIFLAPFDFVVGNPPWVGWENLPAGYRNESKRLWQEHGLFVHSGIDTILGKGKKDISMLMTYVAADSYLKDGGTLAFVITQAVFKMAGAAQGFRRFQTRRKVPLNCLFVDDFSELQLFEGATNKTSVFVLRKGSRQKYPVSYLYWRKAKAGRTGSFGYDATLAEVIDKTERKNWKAEPSDPADPTSAWLTGNEVVIKSVRKVLGKSDYKAHQGVNTGGANAVYWFELIEKGGGDTLVVRNIVDGAKRKVESAEIPVEAKLLFPLIKGGDVQAWIAKPSAWLLFVQDVHARRGIEESELKRYGPMAYEWLKRHKGLLTDRAAYKRYFKDSAAFYTMFDVGTYTLAPFKVVWPRIARTINAAVVINGEKAIIPQETFSFIDVTSEVEAWYVAGVMNSTPFRMAVSSFSQPGSKSFGTPSILVRARIPQFQPRSETHVAIVTEARNLAAIAAETPASIYPDLDKLCAPLWELGSKDLRALEIAYSEIYKLLPR